MKYKIPIAITIIIVMICLILYRISLNEAFTPVSSDVDKIISHISAATTQDYSTYTKFLTSNNIKSKEYHQQEVFIGLIILKKLGLLTNANITKLLQ